jgi:hypothetical protein
MFFAQKNAVILRLAVVLALGLLTFVLVECGGPFSFFGLILLLFLALSMGAVFSFFVPFKPSGKRVLNWIVAVALLNFFAFLFVSSKIGGTAVNGYVANGKYFVGEHGVYTEVSRGIWFYSYAHATCVLITHLSVGGVGFCYWIRGDI